MGFTGIGLDGEYIEKPEDKNDESEDEDEIKESWNGGILHVSIYSVQYVVKNTS